MSGLCGWFSSLSREAGGPVLRGMVEAAAPGRFVQALSHADTGAGIAAIESNSRPGLIEVDGCFLVFCGHPHLRAGGHEGTDPIRLARYLQQRSAREALAHVGGDFAIAFWDSRARRGWFAVDRIGVHQLVYTRVDTGVVFASSLDALAAYPGVKRELENQALFDYLFYHASPGPDTIFVGQKRIPPGHYIEYTGTDVQEPAAYWSLRFNETRDRPIESLKSQFRELVLQAVQDSAADSNAGAFLSGGTDSSTVSGMLARLGTKPAQTFSIGFDVAGYDEMSYARIAARHFQCEHHEYYVTPDDVVDALPRIAASYDQPFGNASAVPTYYCARLAREHGVTRLLAGDGGDELFGGNERYAKQHLLGLYQNVPNSLRRSVLEPLLLASTALHRLPPLRKLKSYVEQARVPMPQRYESYNLLNQLGNENIFEPDFLDAIDVAHPEKLLEQAHAPFAQDSLINQMLAVDLRFVLADSDLPKVTRMCDLGNVDVAFPLLDDRLIEFSATLSADLKLRRTNLRWFFKQALIGFLPQEIITKQKHGFGLPVGAWLSEHAPLRRLAADSIASLRSRHIVQPRFVDDLVKHKLLEHPAYFGTMVWVLMALGLWLEARRL
jgi:asparagine synthase (glutamine-hydrolysing)